MRVKRLVAYVIATIILVVALILFVANSDRRQAANRRAIFIALTYGIRNYEMSTFALLTDELVGPPVAGGVKANSWRLKMYPIIENHHGMKHGFPTDLPWYAEAFATLRLKKNPWFNRRDNLCSMINSVTPGGPGAGQELTVKSTDRQRRLVVVESYPEDCSWYEAGDLDLLNDLKTKSVAEALHLRQAGRDTFFAGFYDCFCIEVKASIPGSFVVAWIEGKKMTEEEARHASEYIVWASDPILD